MALFSINWNKNINDFFLWCIHMLIYCADIHIKYRGTKGGQLKDEVIISLTEKCSLVRNLNCFKWKYKIYIYEYHMSMYTVTPAYGITSFKQSPVFKGHLFPVIENFIWIKPLLRGHLSWKTKKVTSWYRFGCKCI
jgi:hypothetical protein